LRRNNVTQLHSMVKSATHLKLAICSAKIIGT